MEFTEDALRAVAKKAIKRKTGARGLRGILEGVLSQIMFEMPTESYTSVVITAGVVDGTEEPVKVMEAKNA